MTTKFLITKKIFEETGRSFHIRACQPRRSEFITSVFRPERNLEYTVSVELVSSGHLVLYSSVFGVYPHAHSMSFFFAFTIQQYRELGFIMF